MIDYTLDEFIAIRNTEYEQSRLASGLASHGEVIGNIFQSPELLKR